MANVTTPDKPGFPEVYELAVTDPVAGGPDGVDNVPHKQLAERTEYLKAEADAARADIDAQDKRLGLVEGSSAVAVSDALRLAWKRSDEGYSIEMFSPGMTFIDVDPINVTRTVKDDDSVDVDRTDILQVGRTYVIYGDNGQESVTVGEILNNTRFKATANLTRTLISGKMSQTDWKIGYGKATAPASGIYYSNEIDVLRYYNDGMLNIRRDKGEGRLTVSARVIGGEWQDVPLVETVEEQSGTRDEFYKLPIGGNIQLRAVADKETVVNHMMVYTSPEAGRAYPIDQPKNLTPAQGAVNVMDPVTLTGTAPYSLYGKKIVLATIRIATDKNMQNIIHTGTVENPTGELSYTVPGGTHAVDGSYFWDFFYTDEQGAVSLCSIPTGYSTAGVFEYVVPPIIVAPANNATEVMAPLTVQLSDFSVFGSDDAHAASKLLASYSADMSDPFYDSGEVEPGGKIEITEADGLVVSEDVYLQPFHKGTTLGWSAAGSITHLRTADVFNAWRGYTATLDSQINSFLADIPYNLSMCKVSDTCLLTAFRLGSGLTLKCVALTRGSAEAVDFTTATPFDVSPVDVDINGLSALAPMGSNHVLSFFDPDFNLDGAVACRLLAKGATEADWAVSGSGIPLSTYGYLFKIKAAKGNELGAPCIYIEERALNETALVVSDITRPSNTSNVLTKNEIFVDMANSPNETAIVSMSESEVIFAYSYGGPPFNVKLYSLSRADSSSPWEAAQLITTYESLAQSAQYLELTKMSADRFVLSYYEGDLNDDRVRGKIFNRVDGNWTAGNEFLTKAGENAAHPVLASPNEETVVIVYGTSNTQAQVMVYEGADWVVNDPVTVADFGTAQKELDALSGNQLALLQQGPTGQGSYTTMIAG
ncbi:hypothetical protein [Maridesulfovibrio sp.]|uniref:hypothetical protein n=1 Tax=Maridesulfovibrio sp. TaxID=2795000 RepID=UPI003B00C172